MQFLLTTQKKNDYVVFYLAGNLDWDGARKLNEAFTSELGRGEKHFVLNLEGLKLIASYSLSTILKLSYLAKKQNGSVTIICPEGNVWDVFYILEIGKVVPLFPSEEKFWQQDKNARDSAGGGA
jgi:anti-anti-sigma factor